MNNNINNRNIIINHKDSISKYLPEDIINKIFSYLEIKKVKKIKEKAEEFHLKPFIRGLALKLSSISIKNIINLIKHKLKNYEDFLNFMRKKTYFINLFDEYQTNLKFKYNLIYIIDDYMRTKYHYLYKSVSYKSEIIAVNNYFYKINEIMEENETNQKKDLRKIILLIYNIRTINSS
jgi:hypothetical protein